jgi:hypothetical protein
MVAHPFGFLHLHTDNNFRVIMVTIMVTAATVRDTQAMHLEVGGVDMAIGCQVLAVVFDP